MRRDARCGTWECDEQGAEQQRAKGEGCVQTRWVWVFHPIQSMQNAEYDKNNGHKRVRVGCMQKNE